MVWLKGAKVQLYKEEKLIAEGYTDQKGYFSASIPKGRYRILITYDEKLRLEWYQDIAETTKFAVKLQKFWKGMTMPVQVLPYVGIQTLRKTPVSIAPKISIQTEAKLPSFSLTEMALFSTEVIIPEALKLISEIETTTDVTEVEFTGLNIITHRCYLLIMMVKNTLAVTSTLSIHFVGDTVLTNYNKQYLVANLTNIGANRLDDSYFADMGTNQSLHVVMFISLTPTNHATALITIGDRIPDAMRSHITNIFRKVTQTNITRITIKSNQTGGIATGSKFFLFAGKA